MLGLFLKFGETNKFELPITYKVKSEFRIKYEC